MAATIEQLTHEALNFTEAERARLALTLLRSLEAGSEDGVQEAWDEELARRVSRVREGTAQGRPADEVLRQIRARYGA